MKRALFAAATLLAAAACDTSVESDPCMLPYIQPSLRVTVQDSVTGANVTPGSTLLLRSGVVPVDSVTAPPEVTSMLVGASAGTFTLTVRRAGYQSWTRSGIEVQRDPIDECVALTLDVTTRLQPAP